MDRKLRLKIRENVDEEGSHWLWLGKLDKRLNPEIYLPGGYRSCRRIVYEEYCSPLIGRVGFICGQQTCIAPDHLTDLSLTCRRGHSRAGIDGRRQCPECQKQDKKRPVTCPTCQQTMRFWWRPYHVCPGAPAIAPRARSMQSTAITDAIADWERGITPERIVRALETTPGALLQQYHRQKIDKPHFRRDLERLERERKCLQPGD